MRDTSFRRARPARAAAALVVTALLAVSAFAALAATTPAPTSTKSSGATKPATTAAKPATPSPKATAPQAAPKKAGTTTTTTTHKPAAPAAPAQPVAAVAKDARGLEDLGLYGQAAEMLASIRGRVPRDADLELSLALDYARSGRPDSAAAILWSPPLSAAVNDTGPLTRYNEYPWPREGSWLTGRFEGWHWYVARARAEVAMTQRRWQDGYEASLITTRARALSGKEWLIRSVLAGRAGAMDDSRASALMAVTLDPTLPEAQYVQGLWEWRDGRRSAAAERFRYAVGIDSTYRPAALALSRVRLPVQPDSFPSQVLTGLRAVALLSSPVGPKIEEFVQMDSPAAILSQVQVVLPDSMRNRWNQIKITPVVLVDERGQVVVNDLPWTHPVPGAEGLTGAIVSSLRGWRFRPAVKGGRPHPVWAAVDITVAP